MYNYTICIKCSTGPNSTLSNEMEGGRLKHERHIIFNVYHVLDAKSDIFIDAANLSI